MKRGDSVIAAARGTYTGKLRPALVQSDLFNPTHRNVTGCLIFTDFTTPFCFGLPSPPGERTSLKQLSQIMIDKIVSLPREHVSLVMGHIDAETGERVNSTLRRRLTV